MDGFLWAMDGPMWVIDGLLWAMDGPMWAMDGRDKNQRQSRGVASVPPPLDFCRG